VPTIIVFPTSLHLWEWVKSTLANPVIADIICGTLGCNLRHIRLRERRRQFGYTGIASNQTGFFPYSVLVNQQSHVTLQRPMVAVASPIKKHCNGSTGRSSHIKQCHHNRCRSQWHIKCNLVILLGVKHKVQLKSSCRKAPPHRAAVAWPTQPNR